MNFKNKITSTAEAEGFLFCLHDSGLSFHPEDNPASIINSKTGQRVFTDQQAADLTDRMEEVYFYMVDPCDYLLNLMHSTDRE